jgi:hypothetical protein
LVQVLHVGGINLPKDFVIASLGNSLRNLIILNYMPFPRDYFVFFLDDDNIVHPSLWNILPILSRHQPRVYTFDQWRAGRFNAVEILKGAECKIGHMDTSSHTIHASILEDPDVNKWDVYASIADGLFAEKVCGKYGHTYIPLTLSYYNALYNVDMQRESSDALSRLSDKRPETVYRKH